MSDLAAALDVVGALWTLLIVERLLDGPQRYGDLQRALGVPTNMLATRLRELEAAGVLSRLPLLYNTRACALTDRGRALRLAIVALGRWAGKTIGPTVGCRHGTVTSQFPRHMPGPDRTTNRHQPTDLIATHLVTSAFHRMPHFPHTVETPLGHVQLVHCVRGVRLLV